MINFFRRDVRKWNRIQEYDVYLKAQKELLDKEKKELAVIRELIQEVPHQDLPRFRNKTKLFSYGMPSPAGFKEWWWKRKHPDKLVLVNLALNNGKHMSFLAKEDKRVFYFRKKTYAFDVDSKYENLDAGFWCYDFHEDISLPIKRVYNVTALKKATSNLEVDVRNAINPQNLKEVLDSKLVESVIRGAGFSDVLRRIVIICVIILVAVVIHLLLFAWKTGMLSKLKTPITGGA